VPENSGTGEVTKFPGPDPGAYYSTGLDGSASTGAMESPPLMTVGIVPVYQSSQGDLDRVTVGVGDTFSASGDNPVVPSALVPGYADATGIGKGHVLGGGGR
jgi:hypothetical protein